MEAAKAGDNPDHALGGGGSFGIGFLEVRPKRTSI
jgi:hypothetical protein